MCAHLLLRDLQNYNSLLNNCQQDNVESHQKKKDTPHPRAKEKPQKDGRRGEITFRIKPHTRQRCSKDSDKPCKHQENWIVTCKIMKLRTFSNTIYRSKPKW